MLSGGVMDNLVRGQEFNSNMFGIVDLNNRITMSLFKEKNYKKCSRVSNAGQGQCTDSSMT